MTHGRNNSVRDKVIGKKWIYSERSTLHRQSGGHRRGWMQPQNVAGLVFIGWVISYASEWEDYSNYSWEGVEISRIWAAAPLLGHLTVTWNCHGTSGCVIYFLIQDQGLVLSALWVPFDSRWFMLCPWAMPFFQKLCPAPFPLVTLWLTHTIYVISCWKLMLLLH